LLLQKSGNSETTTTCNAFGYGIGEKVAIHPVSITIFVEDPLEHGLEGLFEELLNKNGLELLADSGGFLLLGSVLRMSHFHKHGGVHAYILFPYSVGFHNQLMMSSACKAPAFLMD
jgi:hypothetical protein